MVFGFDSFLFVFVFRNQLCRSKVYCRTVGDRQGELHDLLDKLMTKIQKLSESSVCLYYFRYEQTNKNQTTDQLVINHCQIDH